MQASPRPGSSLLWLPWLAMTAAPSLAQDEPPAAPPVEQTEEAAPASESETAESGGVELTLEQAIEIVLDRNLQLEIEAGAAEIARFDAIGSWGAFDPVFSSSANYFDSEQLSSLNTDGGSGFVISIERRSYQQGLNFPLTTGGSLDFNFNVDNTETSNPNASLGVATDANASISYTQPLLRGAWEKYTTTDQRLARLNYGAQIERTRQVRQDLVLQVHEAYWNLVEANQTVGVRELSLRLGQEQLDQDRRRLDVGVGTEVDVLQAETNVATNEQQLLLAEVNAEAAMDTLKSLLFRRDVESDWAEFLDAWEQPLELTTALPEVSHEEKVWTRSLGRALSLRTELEQQRLEVESSVARLVRAEGDTLPGLDLSLSASNRGFDGSANEAVNLALGTDFPTYTAGLTFTVPLFNRRAGYAKRSARATLRNARLNYDRIELDVVADVRARVRDVNYQAAAVAAAQKSLELAERQLQAEQARYDEGLSTTFQVLQFQETLAEALVAERAARAAYARNLAQLQRSEGWIGEDENQ